MCVSVYSAEMDKSLEKYILDHYRASCEWSTVTIVSALGFLCYNAY